MGDLPKLAVGVNLAEQLCSCHLGESLVHLWDGVDFSEHTLVQKLQVPTDPHRAGTFSDYHHAGAPWSWVFDLGNHPHFLHSLEFLFHFSGIRTFRSVYSNGTFWWRTPLPVFLGHWTSWGITSLTLRSRCKEEIAGNPSRLALRPRTTKIV